MNSQRSGFSLITHHSSLITALDFLWLAALVIYVLAGTALVPFHGDESTQIYMSRDYAYQFMQRDLELVTYHDPAISEQEQHLRLLNGTVNKYLIGLAWHLGGFELSDVNEQWDWFGSFEYNMTYNHAPSDELLVAARMPSSLLMASGAVLIFLIGRIAGGRPAAYAASLYFALHPALLINGRRAMMEGSLIAFSLLTVLAALWWLRRRRLISAIALGTAAGLAIASKHTAVFTVAAVFAACGVGVVVEWVTKRPHPQPLPEFGEGSKRSAGGTARPSKGLATQESLVNEAEQPALVSSRYELPAEHPQSEYSVLNTQHSALSTQHSLLVTRRLLVSLISLLVAALVALGVFYALNPAWWGDPLARAGDVLEMRQFLLEDQTEGFGGYASAGDALAGLYRQAIVAAPQYFEVGEWATYIADQVARYEASVWRGLSFGVLLIPLLALGVWYLMRWMPLHIRLLIGFWALTMLLSVGLLTPIEWQRYYLPLYPAIGVIAGLGVAQIARWLQRRDR